jgi:hypothetical protein
MSLWWRRARGWVLFAGAALVGGGCGVVAGYVVGQDRRDRGGRGHRRGRCDRCAREIPAGQEIRRQAALAEQVLGGGLSRVRDLTDPILFGVHPAAADDVGRVPPYVRRDVERRLDAAIRAGGFVLLSGEFTAGKSRVAYQAMRRLLPDHVVLAPAVRESVKTVVDVVLEQRRCVVWLDDVNASSASKDWPSPRSAGCCRRGGLARHDPRGRAGPVRCPPRVPNGHL